MLSEVLNNASILPRIFDGTIVLIQKDGSIIENQNWKCGVAVWGGEAVVRCEANSERAIISLEGKDEKWFNIDKANRSC